MDLCGLSNILWSSFNYNRFWGFSYDWLEKLENVGYDAHRRTLDLDDDALLDAMVANPILIERPFVVTAKGTRLARPIDAVDEIL